MTSQLSKLACPASSLLAALNFHDIYNYHWLLGARMANDTNPRPFTSKEEFLDQCEFASQCNWDAPSDFSSPFRWRFILVLQFSFDLWRLELGIFLDFVPSIQFILSSRNFRSDLASAMFRHGHPTESHEQATFNLLFQAAYVRHLLVTKAAPTPQPQSNVHNQSD